VHHNAGINPDDVLALVDHGAPPFIGYVTLKLNAEWAVIVTAPEAAINLRALKYKTPAFTE
jgi:hypothetical protein